jgi:hypothetical protein
MSMISQNKLQARPAASCLQQLWPQRAALALLAMLQQPRANNSTRSAPFPARRRRFCHVSQPHRPAPTCDAGRQPLFPRQGCIRPACPIRSFYGHSRIVPTSRACRDVSGTGALGLCVLTPLPSRGVQAPEVQRRRTRHTGATMPCHCHAAALRPSAPQLRGHLHRDVEALCTARCRRGPLHREVPAGPHAPGAHNNIFFAIGFKVIVTVD